MKIPDIFRKYVKKVQLEAIFDSPEEQEELVTILEFLGYHFKTGTPLREFHFQDNDGYNSYSFWGGRKVAIGYFRENLNWMHPPKVLRYEDYHPLYLMINEDMEEEEAC